MLKISAIVPLRGAFMLKEIDGHPGLFGMDETALPCLPSDLTLLGRYSLRESLHERELDEAAARVLCHSQKLNRWVGVDFRKIWRDFKEDILKSQENLSAKNEHVRTQWKKEDWIQIRAALHKMTLGFLKSLAPNPADDVIEFTLPHPDVQNLFSIFVTQALFAGCNDGLPTAIYSLVEKGYLTLHREGDPDTHPEEYVQVLFPTAKLLEKIMEVEKRYAQSV